jgi:hypothetical protein
MVGEDFQWVVHRHTGATKLLSPEQALALLETGSWRTLADFVAESYLDYPHTKGENNERSR